MRVNRYIHGGNHRSKIPDTDRLYIICNCFETARHCQTLYNMKLFPVRPKTRARIFKVNIQVKVNTFECRGRSGRGRMVIGFTTTCAISAYHHQSCEFEPHLWRGELDTTLCDKVCQ
jgi:hypothetical protein